MLFSNMILPFYTPTSSVGDFGCFKTVWSALNLRHFNSVISLCFHFAVS